MFRRMEDKIRQLCEAALTEKDPERLHRILVELRETLHKHVEQLRGKLAHYPITVERRRHVSESGLASSEAQANGWSDKHPAGR